MSYLEELGIHPDVRSFFNPYITIACQTLIFKQADYFEQASRTCHRIPITESLWIAGEPALATDLLVCSSAMDGLAWLNQNHQRYRQLSTLCLICTGSVPYIYHAAIIQKHTPKRKLHFLYSSDDLGAMCDLKLASFIRNKPLTVTYHHNSYLIRFENKNYEFAQLSLNALEKSSGYNFKIRTHKPKNASTYYEQLRSRYLP
jgi:hypothetical protein